MSNPFEEINSRLENIESILIGLKFNPGEVKNQEDPDQFLTVKDAANFLKLAVPTIYSLISKGELPVMKRSQRCYFLKTDLVKYLKEGRKKSLTEIEAEADNYINNKKGPNNG